MGTGENPLRNVSDTALWVAIYRAMESERPDALFRDPFARRLGGARGEEIVARLPRGRASAWPMIVRTAVMDEIILGLIEREHVRTVVNLAAGLDVRPFRLPLPPALRWLHVDLPPMIDYLREGIGEAKTNGAVEFVPADLRDPSVRRAVLESVAEGPSPSLAVAEGLLIYLPPSQVADLASALADTKGLRYWLIDLAAPKLLKMLTKRWQPHLAAAGAPFVFAPSDGTAFFSPFGWKEVSFHSLWDEASRLHRTPRGSFMWGLIGRLLPRSKREEFRRMSGMVLLERA